MRSLADVRALLGASGAGKSDEELEQLRDAADSFARLLVQQYVHSHRSRSASLSTSMSLRRVSARRHSKTLTLNTEDQC